MFLYKKWLWNIRIWLVSYYKTSTEGVKNDPLKNVLAQLLQYS